MPQYAAELRGQSPIKYYRDGGWINEHVVGYGQRTGTRYEIAENEPEYVVPQFRASAPWMPRGGAPMGGAWGGGSQNQKTIHVEYHAHTPARGRLQVEQVIHDVVAVLS